MARARSSRSKAPRGTGREIPALLACLVWIGGFEAAPFLHVVDHAALAPHTHAPAHCHGGVCHDHEDEPAEDAPDPEHGDGSLAHRGLAARTPPPALPPIQSPWSIVVSTASCTPTPIDAPLRERPRARAPPV